MFFLSLLFFILSFLFIKNGLYFYFLEKSSDRACNITIHNVHCSMDDCLIRMMLFNIDVTVFFGLQHFKSPPLWSVLYMLLDPHSLWYFTNSYTSTLSISNLKPLPCDITISVSASQYPQNLCQPHNLAKVLSMLTLAYNDKAHSMCLQ